MRLLEILPPRPGGAPYSCADLARRIGKHPNTLRKYEGWGFLRPVPRLPNGYRTYDREHALEALFAATVMRTAFKDWRDHRRMKILLRTVRSGDYASAGEQVRKHRRALGTWLENALSARRILKTWQKRRPGRSGEYPSLEQAGGKFEGGLSRPQAAAAFGVAPDTLRDWERSGLFTPVRLPNGRRRYPPEVMDQIEIIRVRRQAGYSLMGIRSLIHGPDQTVELSHARDRWDMALRAMIDDCRLMEEIIRDLARHQKPKKSEGRVIRRKSPA